MTERTRQRSPRALLTFAWLLLAGVVVNIAVAWTLVGAPDSWTPGGPEVDVVEPLRGHAAARRSEGDSVREQLRAPPSWGPVLWFEKRRGLGWTTTDVVAGGFVPDLNWHGARLDGGWPMRSLAWVKRSKSEGDRTEWQRYASPSIDVPLHLLMDSGWFDFDSSRDQIPLTPILPGFAINTLFYAALLALPLGVARLRHRGGFPDASGAGAAEAPRRWRLARWLGLCIAAVAIVPGAILALMASLFGAALVGAILANIVLLTVLLTVATRGRRWAAHLPAAVVLSIMLQLVGVVAMALMLQAVVPA